MRQDASVLVSNFIRSRCNRPFGCSLKWRASDFRIIRLSSKIRFTYMFYQVLPSMTAKLGMLILHSEWYLRTWIFCRNKQWSRHQWWKKTNKTFYTSQVYCIQSISAIPFFETKLTLYCRDYFEFYILNCKTSPKESYKCIVRSKLSICDSCTDGTLTRCSFVTIVRRVERHGHGCVWGFHGSGHGHGMYTY